MFLSSQSLDIKPIFVARQPIYDEKEKVFAYELLFRNSASATASSLSDDEASKATAAVIADGFTLAFNGADNSKKAFINFPQGLLFDDSVYALPKEVCVVEVQGNEGVSEELIQALGTLRNRGYTIALDSYSGLHRQNDLLPHVDIVKVDVLAVKGGDLLSAAKVLRGTPCRMLAEKIETRDDYRTAFGLGFTLFQGYLFSKPETIAGSKAPTPNPIKMKLLSTLAVDDYDTREATSALSSDPALCYRLLHFVNSASFGLRAKIQSVQQAITLLGRQKLRHWLLAVIISELGATPRIREAAYLSLQRARYLEVMAGAFNNLLYPQESLFLLGLFSKLDILLGQPMERLLERVPLASGMINALLGLSSPYRGWLGLVEDIEAGRWHEVEAFLSLHEMDHEESSRYYAESMQWADSVLRYSEQA